MNFFLQFENIILLLNLSKSNQTITIQVCNMIELAICEKLIINPNPTSILNTPLTFNYSGFKYVLNLDRIGADAKILFLLLPM